MQGLAHYRDDSLSPPSRHQQQNQAGPSRPRNDRPSAASSSRHHHPRPDDRPSTKRNHSSPVVKRRKTTEESVQSPENLTHTSQAALPDPELNTDQATINDIVKDGSSADRPPDGLTEDEIFRRFTVPPPIHGLVDWGIPPEVDPEKCDPKLKAKVAQFLDLKYARGQHINTSLLSSTSFSNPHIYSKLVEFVDLSERATMFPRGGWITRQNLEDLVPEHGPKSMNDQQKRMQEETKRAQEAGKRKTISFAPSRHGDSRSSTEERGSSRGMDQRRDDRDRDRYREKDRDRRDRDRNRDRHDSKSKGSGDRDAHRSSGWDEKAMRRDKREWDRRR